MTDSDLRPIDPAVAPFAARFGVAMGEEGLDVHEWRRRYTSLLTEQGQPAVSVPTREIVVPTRHGTLKARLYSPAQPAALLVYAHGGGFVVGNLDCVDLPLHELSSGANLAVLSLSYALAPEHPYPIALEQIQDSLVWADNNRSQLGVDLAAPLGMAGDSAGGNLAALTCSWAAQPGRPRVSWQALINPVLDFPAVQQQSTSSHVSYGTSPMLSTGAMLGFLSSYFVDSNAMVGASPLLAQTDLSLLPTTFIAAGECDALRDDSIAYAEKLSAAGVDTQLRVYEGMPHNFIALTKYSAIARRFLDDFISAADEWATQT